MKAALMTALPIATATASGYLPPGGRSHPGYPQTEAEQLLPRLAGAPTLGLQGPLCRGGISTRRVDALLEALGGASGISKSEVSRFCQGLDVQVKAFMGRPLDLSHYPYVYLNATYLHDRLCRNLQVVSRALVVAIGIKDLGYREVLGIAVGDSEAEGFCRQFLVSLKEWGLTGAIKRMFQGCACRRCRVHFLRNLLSHVPKGGRDMVAAAI